MQKMKAVQFLILIALGLFLASGCAKKPAPTVTPSEPAPSVVAPPAEEPKGISEEAVTETPVEEPALTQKAAVAPGLERIFFDFDQYTLTSQARETLAGNAAFIKANPGARVVIEGHCDERGSDEYNLALGERRAQAAKDYLQSLGVSASTLTTISYGEEMPLDPSSTEEAWAKNRRAEFKVAR